MIILLTGVSCVGKSTIGRRFAEDVGFQFFDLDVEIERFYGKTISRLQQETITPHSWRAKGAPVLKKILDENRLKDTAVAMPPSGLMDPYLRLIKKSKAMVVVLTDEPENILKRITFFDIDSKPMNKKLNTKEKKHWLSEIKKDITYYKRSYSRAHFQLDIAGLEVGQAATALKDLFGLDPPLKKAKRPKLRIVPKRPERDSVTYTNRRGKVYYLHVGKTKQGNPRYHFSTRDKGDLAAEIPVGYEVYENPNSQVYLRRIVPRVITNDELEIVDRVLKNHARPNAYRLDVRGEVITVFESSQRGQSLEGFPPFFSMSRMQEFFDQHAHFTAVLRFILTDEKKRLFVAERYCFMGSIEDWIPSLGGGPEPLKDLVDKYVPHLGQESFFDLM